MSKCGALIIALVFILSFDHLSAQDWLKTAETKATKRDTKIYHLVSIDGKNQTVKIIPDYEKHVLKVTYLKDNITISDFWGVPPETYLLNKSFIEIRYAVRGGSNLGLGNSLIICVNGPHLYEAMHVLNYINSETGDEKQHYNIKLIVTSNREGNYGLKVHVHDDLNSKRNPETNYIYNNESVLAFDTAQNAFYSVKENLYDHFITTKNKARQKVAGIFPMIILGKETYYFINGRWYTGNLNKEIFGFK
ncbi:hypothetical protein SNE26_27570 [Mucilaginibacter sp. cycad4]|uniref:hypothetical protein n=1 Tax=Mucilaginibacter sp. cycad4 TaxID=3342096 RepID=UPI002AABF39D|nr:hypothetical protein [Mucilaginibacter gossypii]WPU99774.1 hypothetical protein SNE26_27570 [Mucilaginibacter gossypii]